MGWPLNKEQMRWRLDEDVVGVRRIGFVQWPYRSKVDTDVCRLPACGISRGLVRYLVSRDGSEGSEWLGYCVRERLSARAGVVVMCVMMGTRCM